MLRVRKLLPSLLIKPAFAAESEADIEDILGYIHWAETSEGTNTNPIALHNRCKVIGRSNEMGFNPFTTYGDFQGQCFESHEDTLETVRGWIETRLEKGLSVRQLLCYYNEGVKREDCPYALAY